MSDTVLLSGDARLLTLKIAAPGVTAMLASSACQLFEALVLAQNDTPLSAAVGACLALILLEQTVGFTLGMGAGSFVSRCIGQSSVRHTSSSARQSHREAAGRAAGAAFFSALLLSGLLLIGGFFLAAPLLRLLGAPESAVSAGVPYARYVLASGPPLCGGLVLGSLLRAQGKTLPNMAAALVGSSLGAALLAALCLRLNLGVHGAGIAMLARETAVFVVLLGYALRHGELIRPSLRRARFTLPVFAEIMRYGLPTLLRQGATSLSAAMLSRVSAEFGAPVLAGMGLCARAVMPFTSAVILMTMLTQSLGQTVRAALVATSRQGLFLLPLLTLLPHVFGLWGLLACQSVSDVISVVFSWLLTRKVFPLSPFTRSSSPRGGDNRPQTAEG